LGEDAYHKVLQRVLNVLCTISSPEEKRVALSSLNWNQDSSAAPFLKAALNLPQIKSDPVLRISVLSALLEWKDLSVLPLAEDELFRPSQPSEGYLRNLILAMSSLDPRISVPLLSRALKLPDPDVRGAAAQFLQYTKSESALDSLLSALDDPDRNVQFAVMQSLGNVTRQYKWRPHTDTTESDPLWIACIQHWREFGAQRKRTKS
jgi:HEAT repeat protein